MARRVVSELFVSNDLVLALELSFYTTTEELKRLFSPFGLVEAVRLVKDPRTQRPKGFGFVKFTSEVDAQNALKSMNGRFRLHTSKQEHLPIVRNPASQAVTSPICFLSTRSTRFPITYSEPKQHSWRTRAAIVSDSKVPTIFTVDSAGEGIDILPDPGGSSDNLGGSDGGEGGNIFPGGIVSLVSLILTTCYLHGILRSLHL